MAANAQAVRQKKKARNASENIERTLAKYLYFGATLRIDLYRRFAEFDRNGRDTAYALRKQHTRFRTRKDMRQSIWRDFVEDVSAGRRFSGAIADYVPSSERLAIAAGEESGNHAEGFEMAAYIAKSVNALMGAILGALIYPFILVFMFIAMLYFVAYELIPAMVQISPVEEWPNISQALYAVAMYFRDYGVLTMVIIFGLFILNVLSLPKWTGPMRAKFDRLWPVNKIYRQVTGATFVIILAAMQRGGIPLDAALRDVRAIASPWLKTHIETFQKRITGGSAPSIAINTGILDVDVVDTLEDYDEGGSFSKALEVVGETIIEQTITRTKRTASVINILMMLGVAGGMIWTYGSMMLIVMAMQARGGA